MIYDKADDETLSVFSFGDEGPVVDEDELAGDFQRELEVFQRIGASRLLKTYSKGSAERPRAVQIAKTTPERVFRVSKLYQWNGGDPEEIASALGAGRVRARVDAAMSVGKSTKLGPYLARVLDKRVLVVGLDAMCLQQIGRYVRKVGIGKIRKSWPQRDVGAHVCFMTYADFNGHMAAVTRTALFSSFDIVIFDEAFVGTADVVAAKRFFSAFSLEGNSLLLCSATMRDDRGDREAESSRMGTFLQKKYMSVEDVMDSGRLVGELLVDRTMIVVPLDAEVTMLAEYYESNGIDVKCLDSASGFSDLDDVEAWLVGDCFTPRVVICREHYGIGYNLSVQYCIAWAFRSVYAQVDGVWQTVKIPLTAQMVSQVKARTGRGMVEGSGGIIIGEEREVVSEMYPSDEMLAFVKMQAGSVVPLKTGAWSASYSVFPGGLEAMVASNLLRVCLPPEISSRYLCSDGMYSGKFVSGLNFFSQPDHFLMASDIDNEIDRKGWVLADCPIVGCESMRPLYVPVKAEGELALMLYGISAMAEGMIDPKRWRPRRNFSVDMVDSDSEGGRKGAGSSHRLRRIVDDPISVVPVVAPVRDWSYSVSAVAGRVQGPRDGVQIDKGRYAEALAEMEESIGNYVRPEIEGRGYVRQVDSVVAEVDVSYGQVESPGGSKVCELPVTVCEKLNMGQLLDADELLTVIVAAKSVSHAFVGSRLFDAYSGAWESLLLSVVDPTNLAKVVRRGEAGVLFSMIDSLRGRFNFELVHALSRSNVYGKRYFRVFTRPPTADQLLASIRSGSFDNIAQSDAFIGRVKYIKQLIDRALLNAESHNVFLPNYISQAQRGIPLRSVGHLGYVGSDSMVPLPGAVRRDLLGGLPYVSSGTRVPTYNPMLPGSGSSNDEYLRQRGGLRR